MAAQRIWVKSQSSLALSLVSGLVVPCFEHNKCPKPVCGINGECGGCQTSRTTEEGTGTMTINWKYTVCIASHLWKWEMIISASWRRFIISSWLNKYEWMWGSMGRRRKSAEGENRLLFVWHFFLLKQVKRLVSRRDVRPWYVLIFSRLTFQTYPMYQQKAGNTSNDSRRWQSKEICNVSESTCGNERHFYAFLRLRPGIQRRYITIGAEWINAMRSGGRDRSKVPLIVSVRRVVVEKWLSLSIEASRMTLKTSIWPPQTT